MGEFGVPAAIAVLSRAAFKVNRKELFLSGPDMCCALAGIGGLADLTGLLRIAKTARSLPDGRQPPAAWRHLAQVTHGLGRVPGGSAGMQITHVCGHGSAAVTRKSARIPAYLKSIWKKPWS